MQKIENKLKCKKYHLHEVWTVLILNISKNSSKIECIFFFFFVKGGEMDNLNYKKAWITPPHINLPVNKKIHTEKMGFRTI